jgi:queuine/archaeosine tRNA-ribosyltransferase
MKMLDAIQKENLLWLGEGKTPIKEDRSADFIMDSVFNYYKAETPKLPYKVGHLFLDNGTFTASMSQTDLDIDRVIEIQEAFNPNLTIPLDYPFKSGMPVPRMFGLWTKTADNIIYYQNSTNLKHKLVPALHAWDKESLIRNVAWLQKNADSEYIALGSVVSPQFTNYTGFFGDRQPRKELIDMICLALSSIQQQSDFKVHLMGFGSSPLMLHLSYYLGIQSTDSSGYKRKAAFGKIILPGTGERHLGETSADFGKQVALSDGNARGKKDLLLLDKCTCPICMNNKYQLWADWKARAIHNEFILKNEVEKARRFLSLGIDVYEKYLDSVVFKTSSFKALWEYAKARKKYYRISELLF